MKRIPPLRNLTSLNAFTRMNSEPKLQSKTSEGNVPSHFNSEDHRTPFQDRIEGRTCIPDCI